MSVPVGLVEDPVTGSFSRNGRIVCEDCWQTMPQYVEFGRGLVSPESDGDKGGNFAKTRVVMMDTYAGPKEGVEHLQKVVCLPCYQAAFQRVYPGAELPALSAAVR